MYDHVSFKAPYEKKAEAAKKKYAEEMAAYEAKWCPMSMAVSAPCLV